MATRVKIEETVATRVQAKSTGRLECEAVPQVARVLQEGRASVQFVFEATGRWRRLLASIDRELATIDRDGQAGVRCF